MMGRVISVAFVTACAADNKFDRFPALVDELVRLKVDILIITSTAAALVAKKATANNARIELYSPSPQSHG